MGILLAALLTAMVVLFSIFAHNECEQGDCSGACWYSFIVGVNFMNFVAVIIKSL